ncbi:MAG TPA: VOC family protein [Dehalococcoidia bacterium]|jgi:catechol 2,3-dioxygenase-like lactoylglutathione lyase family enzyme|nr:VOC family protein [Dehalococcoidia bacterium]
MLKSFFHTGFVVKDLEKSVDFYTNVLGLQLALRMERQGEFINQVLDFPDAHIKGAMVDKGEGHQLELIQYLNPASGPGGISRNDLGASHLAFFVDDLDKFYLETKERGLRFNNPPASLSDDHGHMLRKAMYAQDPDGNWLEFVELF